jgi:hypothetical protein
MKGVEKAEVSGNDVFVDAMWMCNKGLVGRFVASHPLLFILFIHIYGALG